ncbi:dienelactone hydrolase family protein [Nocardia sp. NBC_01327]|uniref:dienelactone hydrolase family protein n=1 Tax=Nocardia sp. NBC_01327 TaxID=2903593 RepID=UPI002E137081|nr:alpha/beta hydrolase [Nocardia sp. NBC_01327]
MQFTAQTSSNGVLERSFTLGDITGVLFSPESGSVEGAPLLLSGHSGGMHKRAPGLVASAQHVVTSKGYTVAAIDAPGHGDRPRNARDQQWVDALHAARAAGESMDPIITDYNISLAERAVPEWQATIDALQALPEIGAGAPIGYGGTTLGVAIGLMLTIAEPRITAAVFGPVLAYQALIDAAPQLTLPVEFTIAWDDEEIGRERGLELFDAVGSTDKALHIYPGRHQRMATFMADNHARFFEKHLGRIAEPAI